MMTKTKHKDRHFYLTEPDSLLWQKVAATIRPLVPENHQVVIEKGRELDSAVMKEIFGAGDTASVTPSRLVPNPGKPEKRDDYPLSIGKFSVGNGAGLHRKAQRKIARQHFDQAARLDLHGLSQEQAYDLLLHFIRTNIARNQPMVLVITGKGGRAGSVGILRQFVPQWLETAPFRPYVRAVEVAARHHGGEGAFYVQLRRNIMMDA